MICLRLDEMTKVFQPYRFWSVESWNLAYFRRKDHLGNPEISLDQAVRDLVEDRTDMRPDGPIHLMTHLCYLGFRFNPVSFYFCWNKEETQLKAIIAEINNTPWGEQYCYVFNTNGNDQKKNHQFTFKKVFHISPFMSMDIQYTWLFRTPEKTFQVHMENWQSENKILDVSLVMIRREISTKSLTRVLLQYPLMTFRVIWGIYFQALKLWIKRCPFYSHPKYRDSAPLSTFQHGAE
jgi:DUF1365 family protein